MKISEINLEVVQNYLRISVGEDDILEQMELQMYIDSAINYLIKYTGLELEQIEENEYYSIPVLLLIADFYENKSTQGTRYVSHIFDKFINLDKVYSLC